MDIDQLSQINKEFAEHSRQMHEEFLDVFKKWQKKSFRLSIVMALHLPMNLILNLMNIDEKDHIPRLVEDLPDMMLRFLSPFAKIRDSWGKISSKEFSALYGVEYQKQFDEFFPTKEYKDAFQKWFEQDSKKHRDKKKND